MHILHLLLSLRPALVGCAACSLLAMPGDVSRAQPDTTTVSLPNTGREEKATPVQRRREGDTYQGEGKFATTGDRITFFSKDGKESFRVIENLALERISLTLEGGFGGELVWSVAGTITEFRGNNQLLIERAIIKPREP